MRVRRVICVRDEGRTREGMGSRQKNTCNIKNGVRACASTRRGTGLRSRRVCIRCTVGKYVLYVEAGGGIHRCDQRTPVSPDAGVFVPVVGHRREFTHNTRPQCHLSRSTVYVTHNSRNVPCLDPVHRSTGARVAARHWGAVCRSVRPYARVIKSRRPVQRYGPPRDARAPRPSDTRSRGSQRSWPSSPTPA